MERGEFVGLAQRTFDSVLMPLSLSLSGKDPRNQVSMRVHVSVRKRDRAKECMLTRKITFACVGVYTCRVPTVCGPSKLSGLLCKTAACI